jgi:hypothetical protein
MLSGTADSLESIECELGILLAEEERSSEYGNGSQVYALGRAAVLGAI